MLNLLLPPPLALGTKAMESALTLGPSATEGQSQARRRRQRLPLPLLASRLAPWPPSSAHRPATLKSGMSKRKRSSKELPDGSLVKKKRPRLQLSDLPVEILQSIVSLLPIRQAVRTSILSNHWKHVWCSRSNLEFSFKSLVYKKGSRIPRPYMSEYVFIQRVDEVLRQHSGKGVEKLKVQFYPLHSEHAEHVNRWVEFAISSKVKQLILDFQFEIPTKETYSFPLQLFDTNSGSHLQSIKLGSVSLKHPASMKVFVNLKKLELVDVNITDEELKLILFNCNVLEFIGISRCQMLTCVQTPSPSKQLKHLHVSHCPSLQGIELHFGLITLEYEGSLIPLAPPSTLRKVSIKSLDISCALAYMFTELPSNTLPHLEMLTLSSEELERATFPNKPLNFLYLRHVRLELNFVCLGNRTDVLDLSCLLEAAPIMEKLELHMWMDDMRPRYHKYHGKLRSLPKHTHSHLKLVDVTGFYGQKDQLELALHILRNCTVLEAMKIDPRPVVAAMTTDMTLTEKSFFVSGYKVAKKYLRRADDRGIIDIVKVRRKDIKDLYPFQIIDSYWHAFATEDE